MNDIPSKQLAFGTGTVAPGLKPLLVMPVAWTGVLVLVPAIPPTIQVSLNAPREEGVLKILEGSYPQLHLPIRDVVLHVFLHGVSQTCEAWSSG